MLIAKRGLLLVTPENHPDNVSMFCTTRWSGNSTGSFSSFSLSFAVGENPKDTFRNFQILRSVTGVDRLCILNQVHGADIVTVDKQNYARLTYSDGDGLITNEKNLALCVQTADCFNVHLAGSEYVCNLHCGWRSVAADIIGNAAERFAELNDEIKYACIGPGICGDCYEVSLDVDEAMYELTGKKFGREKSGGKVLLSIRDVIAERLTQLGITNIEHLYDCSSCADYLYSYRSEEGHTGRMLSIVLKK